MSGTFQPLVYLPLLSGQGTKAPDAAVQINAGFQSVIAAQVVDEAAIASLAPTVADNTANISTNTSSIGNLQSQTTANTAAIAAIPSSIPAGLTFAQLTNLYTSLNIGGTPIAVTSDQGSCVWSGSTWLPITPYLLVGGAVPFIYGPNGNIIDTSGNFTLGTALDAAYSGYMYWHAGNINASQPNGWYWVTMSTASAGRVWNNQYTFGQAIAPQTLTSFVSAIGAFTQTFTSLPTVQANVPGNGLGLNGELEWAYQWTCTNSGNTKSVSSAFSGSNIFGSDQATTAQFHSTRHLMRNRGSYAAQVGFNFGAGDIGAGNGNNTAAIDTTVGQLATINLNVPSSGSDWIVLQSYSIKCFPSYLKDNPPVPTLYQPSTSTPPQGARVLNYKTCQFLVFPQSSDVSFTQSASSKLFAGLWYEAQPPWSNAHVTNAIVNGVSQLSVNFLGDGVNPNVSTQTQNSTQGALPYLLATNGFYIEWASTLSDNAQDHFCSVYLLPQEHNTANGTSYPYVEIDADEGGNVIANNYTFWGSANTVINWSGGSGGAHTVYNNLSAVSLYGPNIDRSKENVFGVSYDPIAQVMAYWVNGQQQPFRPSVAAYNATLTGKHYYLIICPQSHGLNLPYSQYIRYFSAWTP